MPAIIYSNRREPRMTRHLIVSPTTPGECCQTCMHPVSTRERHPRWGEIVKRCSCCGFAVRRIVEEYPDETLAAELRATLRTLYTRGMHGGYGYALRLQRHAAMKGAE